ncbi:hypothetical protein Syun_023875 [Stephania yunnanensis]|uniref:Uncharacterized protein n=1 Tax=Stephania yunnanensis TaxID=152371 RepID=A0AAP0I3W8_9MAGN
MAVMLYLLLDYIKKKMVLNRKYENPNLQSESLYAKFVKGVKVVKKKKKKKEAKQ